MRNIEIELNAIEFTRFVNWVTDGFMKVIRPFVFRGKDGKMYCLHHGKITGGLEGGYTTSSIREFAEEHSNICADENLYLVSCYGSTVKETDNVKVVNNTPYIVMIGADPEKSCAVFGILENDIDVEEFVKSTTLKGVTADICKATCC